MEPRELSNRKKLLSPEELSDFLGVSIGTVYGWTYQKLIPYFKIGRLARFDPVEIDNWLKNRKIEPFAGI